MRNKVSGLTKQELKEASASPEFARALREVTLRAKRASPKPVPTLNPNTCSAIARDIAQGMGLYAAANRQGISGDTLRRECERNPELAAALNEAAQIRKEMVESRLIEIAMSGELGNVRAAAEWLAANDKRYSKRNETVKATETLPDGTVRTIVASTSLIPE